MSYHCAFTKEQEDIMNAIGIFDDIESSEHSSITYSDIMTLLQSGVTIQSLINIYPSLISEVDIISTLQHTMKPKKPTKHKNYDNHYINNNKKTNKIEEEQHLDAFIQQFKIFNKKCTHTTKQKSISNRTNYNRDKYINHFMSTKLNRYKEILRETRSKRNDDTDPSRAWHKRKNNPSNRGIKAIRIWDKKDVIDSLWHDATWYWWCYRDAKWYKKLHNKVNWSVIHKVWTECIKVELNQIVPCDGNPNHDSVYYHNHYKQWLKFSKESLWEHVILFQRSRERSDILVDGYIRLIIEPIFVSTNTILPYELNGICMNYLWWPTLKDNEMIHEHNADCTK